MKSEIKAKTTMTLAVVNENNSERKTYVVHEEDLPEFRDKKYVEREFTLSVFEGGSGVGYFSLTPETIRQIDEDIIEQVKKDAVNTFIDRLTRGTEFEGFVCNTRKMHYKGETEIIIDALSSSYAVLSRRIVDLKRRGVDVTQTEMFEKSEFLTRLDAAMRTGRRRAGRK